MTFPLCLQFFFTVYKWTLLEKSSSKKWSWFPLVFQCWPQMKALRIMHQVFKNNIEEEEADKKKNDLLKEVTMTEPFLEAWPSVITMTIIWMSQKFSRRLQRRKSTLKAVTVTLECISNYNWSMK